MTADEVKAVLAEISQSVLDEHGGEDWRALATLQDIMEECVRRGMLHAANVAQQVAARANSAHDAEWSIANHLAAIREAGK